MLEKDIQTKIMRYLENIPSSYAWKVHNAGMYTARGIPDIQFVLNGQAYAFEVKRPGRSATQLQQAVMDDMRKAGAIVGVVTSVDDVKRLIE